MLKFYPMRSAILSFVKIFTDSEVKLSRDKYEAGLLQIRNAIGDVVAVAD